MKLSKCYALILFWTALACAQTAPLNLPSDFVAAGVGWNQYAVPQINGWAAYAKKISNGIYSYTEYIANSYTTHPFTLQTTTITGAALYLRNIGNVQLWTFGQLGATFVSNATPNSGTNVVGALGTGGFAAYPLGKGWALIAPVQILKSAGQSAQYSFSFGIGYGK